MLPLLRNAIPLHNTAINQTVFRLFIVHYSVNIPLSKDIRPHTFLIKSIFFRKKIVDAWQWAMIKCIFCVEQLQVVIKCLSMLSSLIQVMLSFLIF